MNPDPEQLLAESVAWWRVGEIRDRRALADAAASGLVAILGRS